MSTPVVAIARRRETLGRSSIHLNQEGEIAMDDDEGFLTNLTLDGVKEGAYMLCRHSDDVLGHHARQAFREKASSMRGENGIYYYLKDLMKRFGTQQRKLKGSDQLVLDEHEFRKLISSDPIFESAITEDGVEALFHRIEHEQKKIVRHQDFLEFCLLDQNQLRWLLFKYRKYLKKQKLTDIEIIDTFKRLCPTNSAILSPELLHATLSRELEVSLTTGELGFLIGLMDFDRDGTIKINDFEMFIKDDHRAKELVHPTQENPIVDLKISSTEAEEITLKREGFIQLLPKIHDDSIGPSMHFWYKKASRDEGKPALTNVIFADNSRDTDLVSKGYVCLDHDINRNGAFGKHKYLWLCHASSNGQNTSEIVDLSLSRGDVSDKNEATLWMPMYRGFKLVPGNLNEKTSKQGVFIWIRKRNSFDVPDLVDAYKDPEMDSPRARSRYQTHIDVLEDQVRKALRRRCPVDQDGALNFNRLFEEFDSKKARCISKQAMNVGVETFGVKMNKKDFHILWSRISPLGKPKIDLANFSQFLELTESEIDEVVNCIQRSMTTRPMHQVPNYRVIFQSYNVSGDGKLSRTDFLKIFAANQLMLTNSEIAKVMQRFDVNKDGVVDYADFLRYVTGVCDAAARASKRIADAAEEIRSWAVEKQNKKLARDGNIDSSTAWKLLKPKRGIIESAALDHVLRQRNIRLDHGQLRLLKILMAPAKNGTIDQAAFHSFVNHMPKKISSMNYDLRKVIGEIPDDLCIDTVYDRLNVEGNGRLSLVNLNREINALSIEKNLPPIDIKDFVYAVQSTGADCGGDGDVLIDRFLASIRGSLDRRNMKNEFVTHYDSPKFVEGIHLLREEIKRCAKTPDGKYNFMIPFKLFDKDDSGYIVLSEFEAAIRELGVDKYLSNQEIKSLMRRFDPNFSGGIDYEEFLRFNLAESSNTRSLVKLDPAIQSIMRLIISKERLSPVNIVSFCMSLKRMFAIMDKESTRLVASSKFFQVLNDMSVHLSRAHVKSISGYFGDEKDNIRYFDFCDAILTTCEKTEMDADSLCLENFDLLDSLYHELQTCSKEWGTECNFLYGSFGTGNEKEYRKVSVEEFKEFLWAAGVRHPYLLEELQSIMNCFIEKTSGTMNIPLFCKFLKKGPSVLRERSKGSLDIYITRLQDELRNHMAGKDAEERLHKLFVECDEDGNGSISKDEFLKVLNKAGLRSLLSQDDERMLLEFLDADGDGVINYYEFVEFALNADNALVNSIAGRKDKTDVVEKRGSQKSPTNQQWIKDYGKTTSANPRSHATREILSKICDLKRQLPNSFEFPNYFKRYRCGEAGDMVSIKNFQKIMEKFLKKLTSRGISHNLHLKHIESIYKHYLNQGDLVDFELFCQDLRISEQVKLSSPSSSSGSSAIEDLSNRDDITMFSPACENERVINGILEDIIRRALLSTDIQYLKQMLKIYKLSLEDREAYVTERKFIKTMSSLPLQLSKSEIDRLSRILVTYQSGKHLYDLGKLLRILEAQLERFDGHSISLPLTQKIYECFFEAAKRNISGRKLLEKCDEDNSGFVSIHEFLTILRLMGCKLSENDIKDLNSCSTGSRINYNQFLDSITHQQSRNQTNIKYALNFHSPSKEKNGIGPVMDKHIQELVIGQMSRIGVSIEQLYDTFKSYDIKASGFVSFDAVASVMHRLGIKVTPEHFRSICSRFTSRLDEKLDYVEFCDLIKPISQKSVPSSLIVQDNLSRNCFQWFDREDSSKKERRLLDSNMILGNIHKEFCELDVKETLEGPARIPLTWDCSVCFHKQTTSTKLCQICGARSPSIEEFKTLQQCGFCSFRNRDPSEICGMCQSFIPNQQQKSQDKNKSYPTNIDTNSDMKNSAISKEIISLN